MSYIIELLYHYWVGGPEPRHWPEHLKQNPVEGHGQYAFQAGLLLGLQLGAEAFFRGGNTGE